MLNLCCLCSAENTFVASKKPDLSCLTQTQMCTYQSEPEFNFDMQKKQYNNNNFGHKNHICKHLSAAQVYLLVSDPPVEHLIEDDEAIRRGRLVPSNKHIGIIICVHDLMGHLAWDVICFYWTLKTGSE